MTKMGTAYDDIIDNLSVSLSNLHQMEFPGYMKPHNFNGGGIVTKFRCSKKLALDLPGDDYQKLVTQAMYEEIYQSLCLKVLSGGYQDCFNNKGFDFVDGEKNNDYQNAIEVSNKIKDHKNAITSGSLIVECIENGEYYSMSLNHNVNSYFYEVGKCNGCSVNVNVFQKISDNYIFLMNECLFECKLVNIGISNDHMSPFVPSIDVEYELTYLINNPKILYVYTSYNMNNYHLYKEFRRDKRISLILNDNR